MEVCDWVTYYWFIKKIPDGWTWKCNLGCLNDCEPQLAFSSK
jgi:hypothetical protein